MLKFGPFGSSRRKARNERRRLKIKMKGSLFAATRDREFTRKSRKRERRTQREVLRMLLIEIEANPRQGET